MNTADIIGLVTAALPVIVALSGGLYQHLLERLPSTQRAALANLTAMAVNAVDQVGANLTNAQKKQYATDIVQSVVKSPLIGGKPRLDPAVVSAIIEATVHVAHGNSPSQEEEPQEPVGFHPATVSTGGANGDEGVPNLRAYRLR
jgi:hypothetical protein